jgi:flagellar motor component MotA
MANLLVTLTCSILGLIISLAGSGSGNFSIAIFGLIIIFIGVILAFVFKNEYDNIIIETRGGKLIIFTVDHGSGKKYIDKIEEDRRQNILN